jgi:hypothetical protein
MLTLARRMRPLPRRQQDRRPRATWWLLATFALGGLAAHPNSWSQQYQTAPSQVTTTSESDVLRLGIDVQVPSGATLDRVRRAFSLGHFVVLSNVTIEQARTLLSFPSVRVSTKSGSGTPKHERVMQMAKERLGKLGSAPPHSPNPPETPDPAPHIFAAHVTPDGRLRLFEALGTPSAPTDDRGSLAYWIALERANATHPGPPPMGSDPISLVSASSYQELFTAIISWTDAASADWQLEVAAYRANTANPPCPNASNGASDAPCGVDYFAVTTSLQSTINGFDGSGCNSYGACGPLLVGRQINYYYPSNYPSDVTEIQHGPLNSNPSCSESFTMGSNIGASFTGGGGGIGFGESLGINESVSLGCSFNEYMIQDDSTPTQNTWNEWLTAVWMLNRQEPPSIATSNLVTDQGAIFSVPEGYEVPLSIGVTTDVQSYYSVNCGFFGLGICVNTHDYVSDLTIWFYAYPPIFGVSPTTFNLCVPENNSAQPQLNGVPTNAGLYEIINYIPSPGVQLSGSTSWTWTSTSGQIQQEVNPAGSGVPTSTINANGVDWQPYLNPASGASLSLNVPPTTLSGRPQPFGVTTETPITYPVFINAGAPVGQPLAFVITTNPMDAAPIEDGQAPNGVPMSVTGWVRPTISSVSPSSVPPDGSTVTIRGSGFFQPLEVLFGSFQGTVEAVSTDGTSIAVLPPLGNGNVPVSVNTNCGLVLSPGPSPAIRPRGVVPGTYTFWPDIHPNPISATGPAIIPEFATGGDRVVISGNGFSNAVGVDFGGIAAPSFVVDPSGTAITATVPSLGECVDGPVDVTVTTHVGRSLTTNADVMTYRHTTHPVPGAAEPHCTALTLRNCEQCTLSPWWRPIVYYVPPLTLRPIVPACPECAVTREEWAEAIADVFTSDAPPQIVAFTDLPPTQRERDAAQRVSQFLPFKLTSKGFVFSPDESMTYIGAAKSLGALVAKQDQRSTHIANASVAISHGQGLHLDSSTEALLAAGVSTGVIKPETLGATRLTERLSQADALLLLRLAQSLVTPVGRQPSGR